MLVRSRDVLPATVLMLLVGALLMSLHAVPAPAMDGPDGKRPESQSCSGPILDHLFTVTDGDSFTKISDDIGPSPCDQAEFLLKMGNVDTRAEVDLILNEVESGGARNFLDSGTCSYDSGSGEWTSTLTNESASGDNCGGVYQVDTGNEFEVNVTDQYCPQGDGTCGQADIETDDG